MTKVLFVEDSPLIQMATKLLFQSFTCPVHFAKNGKEALTLLEENTYDLVFLDLGLSDIPGLELAHEIRKKYSSTTLPLIAITAQGYEDYEKKCLDAGMNAFFTKPLSEENVLEILTKFSKKNN